ncbi:MAG TPA: DUF4384 domain-containing protein [Gemmatimonadales bacterium]|jgi:YD repeat-containing protein
MLTLLATLLVAAPPTDSVNIRATSVARAPAIQISLNNDGSFAPGGRVSVQVQTNDDGYLLVFRVDGDGRIRVLFPLDPDGDAFVRGGKEYELRGRGDHETFLADNQSGNGLVYAAVSRSPYSYRDFVANGHWDYDALRLPDSSSDAENDLTAIVAQMTNHTRFDYDALGYRVQEISTVASYGGDGYYPGYYDPAYDPRWRCLGCGWGYPGDIGIGLNFGYSPYWDPFLYSPWGYNNYGYYGYGLNRGFGGGFFFPGVFPVGRPLRNLPPGTRPRPRPFAPTSAVGSNSPGGVNGHARPSSGAGAPPSARPAPPAGDVGRRARPRPMDMTTTRGPTPYARPTFREPPAGASPGVRYERPQYQPSPSRPVYREPPRVDRSPPPPMRSAPPPSQRSAPPPSSRPAPSRSGGGGGGGGHGGGHGRP